MKHSIPASKRPRLNRSNSSSLHVTRRRAVLGTAAFAAQGALPGTALAQTIAAPRSIVRSGIDPVLRAAIDSNNIPGLVAMAATDRGMVHESAIGSRRMGADAAMTTDTVFRIGSMVKLITSVAAMQLVERGRLKLDAPAPPIDAALAEPQVLTGFDSAGKPQLRPPRRPITLRHLLTHTAGFSYRLWDAKAARYAEASAKDKNRISSPLMFDPGERWAYGTGIDWTGKIVAAASGMPLDKYFRDNITGPLAMQDTSFIANDSQRGRQAHLHVRKADGTLAAQPLEKQKPATSFSGGGGIYSSAPNYLTLLTTLMNNGRHRDYRLLRPETVALMNANQIGDVAAGVMKSMNPRVSSDVDFFPGTRLRWGFGHMINLDAVPGGRSAGSLTWAGLYNTYYWIDPARRLAAVLMTQILPFADRLALDVYRRYEQELCRALDAR